MYLAYIETDVPSRNQSSISVGNYKRLLMLTCKMSVHVCMTTFLLGRHNPNINLSNVQHVPPEGNQLQMKMFC